MPVVCAIGHICSISETSRSSTGQYGYVAESVVRGTVAGDWLVHVRLQTRPDQTIVCRQSTRYIRSTGLLRTPVASIHQIWIMSMDHICLPRTATPEFNGLRQTPQTGIPMRSVECDLRRYVGRRIICSMKA